MLVILCGLEAYGVTVETEDNFHRVYPAALKCEYLKEQFVREVS